MTSLDLRGTACAGSTCRSPDARNAEPARADGFRGRLECGYRESACDSLLRTRPSSGRLAGALLGRGRGSSPGVRPWPPCGVPPCGAPRTGGPPGPARGPIPSRAAGLSPPRPPLAGGRALVQAEGRVLSGGAAFLAAAGSAAAPRSPPCPSGWGAWWGPPGGQGRRRGALGLVGVSFGSGSGGGRFRGWRNRCWSADHAAGRGRFRLVDLAEALFVAAHVDLERAQEALGVARRGDDAAAHAGARRPGCR